MKCKHRCQYCKNPAFAYELVGHTKVYLCFDHIPVDETDDVRELRERKADQAGQGNSDMAPGG